MIRILLILLFLNFSLQAKEAVVCKGEVVLENIKLGVGRDIKFKRYYTATFRVKKDLSKNFRGKKKIVISWSEDDREANSFGYKYSVMKKYIGKQLVWSFYKNGSRFSQNGYPDNGFR